MKRRIFILAALLAVFALALPLAAREKPKRPNPNMKNKPQQQANNNEGNDKAPLKEMAKRVPDYFGFPDLYHKAVEEGLVNHPLPRPLRFVRPELSEDQWTEVHELEKSLDKTREEGFYSILTKKQIELREALIKKIREARRAAHEAVAKKLDSIKDEGRRVKFYAKLLLEEKKRHMKLNAVYEAGLKKIHMAFRKAVRDMERESPEFIEALKKMLKAEDALRRKLYPIKVVALYIEEENYLYPEYFRQNIVMAYLNLTFEQKKQLMKLREQWDEEWHQGLQQILSDEQWESLQRIWKYYHWLRVKKREFNAKLVQRIALGEEKAPVVKDGEEKGDKHDK